MYTEQVISLLACIAVLSGIVLTTLFLLLFFYKKNHPEEWRRTKIVFIRQVIKKRFEDFLRQQKPFLNPDLKIGDITLPLLTRRRSLSAFIRRTYNMDFKQCMNYFRLREVERLQYLGPIRNPIALSVKAGFWSYRMYLRTKEKAEKRETEKEAVKNRPKTIS